MLSIERLYSLMRMLFSKDQAYLLTRTRARAHIFRLFLDLFATTDRPLPSFRVVPHHLHDLAVIVKIVEASIASRLPQALSIDRYCPRSWLDVSTTDASIWVVSFFQVVLEEVL